MNALVATAAGDFAVDLETEEIEPWHGAIEPERTPDLSLPRVVAAAALGSTVVAVVDAKPPLLVSHDAGATWRDSGRGLPPGVAVAFGDSPDTVVYAARNRLYLSENGGLFWRAIAVELPEIHAISVRVS
jgi:hypothetical protein